MKKRTLKKLATTMAIGLLFSTTLAYGSNQRPYSFTLNPTQVAYTGYETKAVDDEYVTIKQTSNSSVIEYTVYGVGNSVKTASNKLYGAGSREFPYTGQVAVNVSLRLKVYNNPADNGGAIRNATGTWIP